MFVLFTDFGWTDPYVGQLKAVLASQAGDRPVIDLLHAVPDYNAHAGALLLAALAPQFPAGCVFICVVDPGVGGARDALLLEADGRYFVGPDNGLLSIVAQRASQHCYWRIDWRPEHMSATFHGRDLFAPYAARLASLGRSEQDLMPLSAPKVIFDPGDLPRIIYLDHYGNAWTGMRATLLDTGDLLRVEGHQVAYRRTFSEAEKGEPFWYANSVGLVEIAVNRGSAAQRLGLSLGSLIKGAAAPDSRSH